MKHKNATCTLVLLMGVSLTMPALALSHGLQYTQENGNAPSPFIFQVQTEYWETDRPDLGGKGIYSYGSELAREPKLFRESGERSSEGNKDARSYSEFLGPSFDMPNSVNGHTGGVDRPFFGGSPSEGDPAVQGLSRMDGGGFASPGIGSGGGSVPGYHGR